MNWLTIDEIKAAARAGLAEALEMSIKHWEQIRDAGWKEFMSGYYADQVSTRAYFCALCWYNRDHNKRQSLGCSKCPIQKKNESCSPEWFMAHKLIDSNTPKRGKWTRDTRNAINALIKHMKACRSKVK